MSTVRIALVGIGKIAREQHLPAISGNTAFELVAAVSPHHRLDGVRNYASVAALLAAMPEVAAVAVCTPPQVRCPIARHAVEHGCDVLLEKPPGVSVNEVNALCTLAGQQGRVLFAAWHAREASGVEPARQWLAQRRVHRVRAQWQEDVRAWHPGQAWIWQAGGLGVFDSGINALSILTRILPGSLVLLNAELAFPSNCQTPIAAQLQLANEHGTEVQVELDFLHPGQPLWNIDIETDDGRLQLTEGGAVLRINGETAADTADVEYRNLYARFAELVAARRSDVDVAPLALVADALLRGRRATVAPFVE